MEKWGLFLCAIGFLSIASSPILPSPRLVIMMGFVEIVVGYIVMRRAKPKKK